MPNIIIHDLMEVFLTHDESSPPVPFHLAASTVIIESTPLLRRDELKPHYAESDKFSHKAGVTKHATNTLADKSHIV